MNTQFMRVLSIKNFTVASMQKFLIFFIILTSFFLCKKFYKNFCTDFRWTLMEKNPEQSKILRENRFEDKGARPVFQNWHNKVQLSVPRFKTFTHNLHKSWTYIKSRRRKRCRKAREKIENRLSSEQSGLLDENFFLFLGSLRCRWANERIFTPETIRNYKTFGKKIFFIN